MNNSKIKKEQYKTSFLFFVFIFLLFAFCFLPITLFAQTSPIVILHTNDTHSHLESYYEPDVMDVVGGVIWRNTFIQKTRKKYPNTIVVDAGDFSQGTPFYNLFKGFPEIEVMNKMGYDVVALGNHEFDNGSKVLAKRLKHADFKIVCANYRFKNKHLSKLVKPYSIINIEDKKVGIFGLLCDMKRIIMSHYYQETIFLDPISVSKNMVDILKNKEQCDFIICLSHLGFIAEIEGDISDNDIAVHVSGIDFIIGGHTHKFIEEPVIVNNTKILQVQNNGVYIGKVIINE